MEETLFNLQYHTKKWYGLDVAQLLITWVDPQQEKGEMCVDTCIYKMISIYTYVSL